MVRMNFQIRWSVKRIVIPSEVENGAAGEPRHGREGRRLSEQGLSESNPGDKPNDGLARSFDFAARGPQQKNPDRNFDPGFEMLPRRCRLGG